jgi:hypothetical protein
LRAEDGLNETKRLGPIWQRLISWGVISEDDARLLAGASPASLPNLTFYSDSGAKSYLRFGLGEQVKAVRKETQKRAGAAAAFLRLHAKSVTDLDELDARVIASLTKEAGMDPAAVRRDLDKLRRDGHYDCIVKEACES